MSKSASLATTLAAAACVVWLSASAGTALADGAPSNEELYRMILELQAAQKGLLDDASRARAEAAQSREQLETTQQELEAARQQLEALTPAAATPPPETPAVSAAAEGEGFVREANLPRGAAPWAEVHVLRATDNNQDFAILSTDQGSILADGSNKNIQSKYETSFKVGAFYSPGGPRDYAFSYQYFNNTGDAELEQPFEQPDGNAYVRLFASLAPPAFGQDAVRATAHDEFRYNSVDAEVGENLRIGEKLALRLFGGVRYTNMNEHFKAYYFGGDFDPVLGARSNFDFGFWGVGPRVGASGRYPLPWGFHLFGQAGVSLLVGEQEAEIGFVDPWIPDDDVPPDAFVHRDNGVRVIPAIDMRAGLGWEHLVGEWGSFFLDGGYEFQNYFGVVEQLAWGPAEATSALDESTGDFGIDGFFFRGGFRFSGP
ncbi:MAG TPA: Lpg1974 family pore-forming outer membrane protein [Myxococcota bacterium]